MPRFSKSEIERHNETMKKALESLSVSPVLIDNAVHLERHLRVMQYLAEIEDKIDRLMNRSE